MSNSTTSNGGTVIVIPANSTWQGVVTIAATLAVAVGGGAATQFPNISVSGNGGSWANGDRVLSLAMFVPAVGVTALTGSQTTQSLSTGPIRAQAREEALTLVLNFGTGVTAVGTAIGEFL